MRSSSFSVATLVAVTTLAGLLPAQEPPPVAAPTPPQDTRVYDFVAAMVGNKAILASQVNELWRDALKVDAQRPPALQQYGKPSRRHALWNHLLEVLVQREIQAQSARLLGRSPDEVEEQVQRLVQDDIAKKAESAGGLSAFARQLDVVGRSMGTEVEESRADIMRSMAYYQGVLRELHDQRAMLATPKEMKALFDADPTRFVRPGSVRLAAARYPRDVDPQGAAAKAAATAAEWRQMPQPVTEEAMKALGAHVHVIDVTLEQEGTPALKSFAPECKPGQVSDPIVDEGWVWVMLCLSRIETERGKFQDADVQVKLRNEIASRHWDQIASRLFPENRVGVKRLPWGEPSQMERTPRVEPGR